MAEFVRRLVRDDPVWALVMAAAVAMFVVVLILVLASGDEPVTSSSPTKTQTASSSGVGFDGSASDPNVQRAAITACESFWGGMVGAWSRGEVTLRTPYVGGTEIFTVQVFDDAGHAGTCVVQGSGVSSAIYELVKLCNRVGCRTYHDG